MAISAKDVQKLREMTGVGMMDCKKALTEANGDFDKAIEWLREKGLAAQTKKAGKIAAEGVSYAITADNGVGVVIEVNSQTDFVAKNEVFQGFVKDLATRHRRQGAGHRREHPGPPLRPLCRGRERALHPHGRQDRRAGQPGG